MHPRRCPRPGPAGWGGPRRTFPVNSTADEVDLTPGDNLCLTQTGTCTLRAATEQANASAGDDVINLPAGDYGLTIGGADEDASATGDLDLNPSGATPERVTITGAGARTTRIIGVAGDRVLNWTDDNIIVDISGVTITGGSGASFGAGIDGGGTFTLTNVAVTGNHADNPATLHNQGGGIFNQGGMTLVNVTLSGNSASGSGNPQGGGLFDLGNVNSSLENVTMSGNSVATTSGGNPQGGGFFYLASTGITATLRNVTIAGNTTGGTQGGGLYTLDPISLGNTIIALNRTAGASPAVSNCAGGGGDAVISLGHNLDEGSDCNFTAATDLRDTDPLLGPLQDNGGQLDTRALLLGSPAIDTGDAAACPATDARGIARPSGAGCDIGAFEFFVPPPPPPDTPNPRCSVAAVRRAGGERHGHDRHPGRRSLHPPRRGDRDSGRVVPQHQARHGPPDGGDEPAGRPSRATSRAGCSRCSSRAAQRQGADRAAPEGSSFARCGKAGRASGAGLRPSSRGARSAGCASTARVASARSGRNAPPPSAERSGRRSTAATARSQASNAGRSRCATSAARRPCSSARARAISAKPRR